MTATATKPAFNRNKVIVSDVVTLDGYQAIMKPSKYGFTLSCLAKQGLIDELEADREELLKYALSKAKNPRRAVCKPEPWVEVEDGIYRLKFTWNEDRRPAIVDTEGTIIQDENMPLFSGSLVKVAFQQRSYTMKDDTYGTCFKLKGVQVVSCQGGAGFESGDLSEEDVASLFGTTRGYVVGNPNVTVTDEAIDDDF